MSACPACGYCPACGRSNNTPYSRIPTYPYYAQQPNQIGQANGGQLGGFGGWPAGDLQLQCGTTDQQGISGQSS
jgi:hypothetical protein